MTKGGRERSVLGTVLACTAVLVTTGCFEHTYHVGAGAPTGRIVYDNWKHHWIGGLIDPDKEIDVAELCPSGNATIENEVSFLNGLVTALTSGIYSPTTVTVRCAAGTEDADLEIEGDEVARIVSDPRFLDWVEAVTPELLEDAMAAFQELDR